MAPPGKTEDITLPPMTQAELNDIIRKHLMFLTAKPGGARAVVRDRDLGGKSFVGQNLSQSDFTGCIMAEADLSGANFESATLFGCDFTGADMSRARLVRADMRGADIGNADLSMADLTGADLRAGRTVLKRKLTSADDIYSRHAMAGVVKFGGSDLSGAVLNNTTAIHADFSDAILENVKMQGANLQGAVLRGTDMTGADLSGSDIRDADFSYATMSGADLQDTEQTGNTKFTLVLTGDTIGQDVGEMPLTLDEMILQHVQWVATAGRQGKQLKLQGIDMRKGVNLASERFTAVQALKCTFAEMDLRSIEMQGATLDESDFRKCQMQSADLRGVRLRGAMLSRADMARANLCPLVITRPDGTSYRYASVLDGAVMRHASFAGARLVDVSFKGADLAWTDFSNADVRKSDFTGAVIRGAKFDGAIIEDAVFDAGRKPRT